MTKIKKAVLVTLIQTIILPVLLLGIFGYLASEEILMIVGMIIIGVFSFFPLFLILLLLSLMLNLSIVGKFGDNQEKLFRNIFIILFLVLLIQSSLGMSVVPFYIVFFYLYSTVLGYLYLSGAKKREYIIWTIPFFVAFFQAIGTDVISKYYIDLYSSKGNRPSPFRDSWNSYIDLFYNLLLLATFVANILIILSVKYKLFIYLIIMFCIAGYGVYAFWDNAFFIVKAPVVFASFYIAGIIVTYLLNKGLDRINNAGSNHFNKHI